MSSEKKKVKLVIEMNEETGKVKLKLTGGNVSKAEIILGLNEMADSLRMDGIEKVSEMTGITEGSENWEVMLRAEEAAFNDTNEAVRGRFHTVEIDIDIQNEN